MRRTILCIALAAFSTGLSAQQRLITWNLFTEPTIVEIEVNGTALGPVAAVTTLPMHFMPVTHPDLAAMAGGRYLVWMAQIGGLFNCRELIAVFDRRTRTASLVPGVWFPCSTVQLIGDPKRPRVFVHRYATHFGSPGTIATVDASLRFQSLIVATWIGTAFAYSADADRLFVTRVRFSGALEVAVFNAATMEEITSFPLVGLRNRLEIQLVAASDGNRLYVYGENAIRAYDVATGGEIAESLALDLTGTGFDRIVLDEDRGFLLVPHQHPTRGLEDEQFRRLLAFDFQGLQFLGEASLGLTNAQTFQPIRGSGPAGAYLVSTPGRDGTQRPCVTRVTSLDTWGSVKEQVELSAMSGRPAIFVPVCSAGARMLAAPPAPKALSASVAGRDVTLRWENSGNSSNFNIEVGFGLGRTDLTVPVGLVTEVAFQSVPTGTYNVRVRAVNELGQSAASNEVVVHVP